MFIKQFQMFKNIFLKNTIIFLGLVFGAMYLVNYLDISPESKVEKKILPNEIAKKIK